MNFSTCTWTMAQYASLEEAFGGKWGTSKPKKTEQIQPSQKVYNSPTRRTEAALSEHSELIKQVTKTLPLGDNENNYSPGGYVTSKNQIEPFTVTDYRPPAIPGTADWSYASTPPSLGQSLHFEAKLDKLMRMVEGGAGGETPSTHDLLLYIFTGVFTLFVLDTFVTLGKHSRA